MDSGRVLLALEEQEKWRERRKRVEERLRQIQSRKRYFARELEAVRGKIENPTGAIGPSKRGAWTGSGPGSRAPARCGDPMTDPLEDKEKERARLRFRERQLLETIRDLDEEEGRLVSELARVDQQVSYYESLARDMKGAIRPAKLSS